jgi:SAM-dependent methyltransferase
MTSLETRRLVEFYSEAGPDFDAWSPGFNMHFGFFRRGLNPFRLEPMLEQMNEEILARLAMDEAPRHVLDLGCGLGATARHLARRLPAASVTGVTVVPWQVERARSLTRDAGLGDRVRFVEGDYRSLSCAAGSFDGVYALESACHASGTRKADFLREAVRALRPGGSLVVADAFQERTGRLGRVSRFCEAQVRRGWCVETLAHLGEFVDEGARLGLEDLRVEPISWSIAPSALFAPVVAARFLYRECVVRGSRLSRRRLDNVVASLAAVALGALRSGVGYFLVTGRKRLAAA